MRTTLTCCVAFCLLSATAQTTHELHVKDNTFHPPFLAIQLGDHVHIVWDKETPREHTFTQVERATWEVNGTTPLSGGFHFSGKERPTRGRTSPSRPPAMCGSYASTKRTRA